MTNLKTRLAVLVLSAVGLLTGAYGQITPSGDAYTNTGSSNTNYGANALLNVDSGSEVTYIQFNLSSIPTGYSGANISKATLKLYVNAVTTAGNFNVEYVAGTWSEGTITAKNSPALGGTVASAVPLTTASANDYILVDITSALQAWVNGTEANNGIALVGNSPLNASFDSKENTSASHPAELDVVFVNSGPQGPVGLQGPAGPQGSAGAQGPQGATGATGAQGPVGSTGAQGPQGATGAQGPAGATGAQGAAGANGVGFNFRNAFDPTATYAVNDVVTYVGSTYVAIAANGPSTQTPDQNPSAWSVMAQQGATGPQGPQGMIGLTGATGATGAQGIAGPPGPQGAQGLMGLPGATGATGPQGLPGQNGAQGPQGLPGQNGATGATGPQGVPGPAGPQGPAGPPGSITPGAMNAALLRWYSQTYPAGTSPFGVAFDGTYIWVTN